LGSSYYIKTEVAKWANLWPTSRLENAMIDERCIKGWCTSSARVHAATFDVDVYEKYVSLQYIHLSHTHIGLSTRWCAHFLWLPTTLCYWRTSIVQLRACDLCVYWWKSMEIIYLSLS
jgi:hypothetical protein